MARPIWFVELLKKFFPGRFFFARLTHLPIIGKVADYSLFRGDDMIYLPSDRTILVNEEIEDPGDMVLPSQVVEHFIEKASYHWIMHTCICRESSECQDFPIHYGCLFLGEAVLQINPQLGRLVSREEALEHVRRCREAGLVHMIGRNRLDALWLGANPGEKLMTICNCCPCCCLWKVLPVIHPMISEKVDKMPGVSVSVDPVLCTGCGTCNDGTCFVDAIHLVNGHSEITQACRGCGRCVEVCPNDAIALKILDDGYIQETIRALSPLVDVT
jgi:ferredoxin